MLPIAFLAVVWFTTGFVIGRITKRTRPCVPVEAPVRVEFIIGPISEKR